ncbi:MAG: hypothetical protein HFH92_06110 [Lachnospiraceae bacterium]|jgi:hypothetical protein|nr:hypothetical protein [uncultured Acetatifactor sp.]MCI8788671.1 hypothetical protein [Lachnospiraceae bacterium]
MGVDMKWEINTEIKAKIEEIQEEARKAEKEIQALEGYRKEFIAIHMK